MIIHGLTRAIGAMGGRPDRAAVFECCAKRGEPARFAAVMYAGDQARGLLRNAMDGWRCWIGGAPPRTVRLEYRGVVEVPKTGVGDGHRGAQARTADDGRASGSAPERAMAPASSRGPAPL